MLYQSLNGLQITFITLSSIILVLGIYLFLIYPRFIKDNPKNYRLKYYKKIYSLVFNEDYYLINNFVFRIEDKLLCTIDHIIFGDKFIYLIFDYYYEGALTGKYNDKSLVLIDNKGKKYYTDNPILISTKVVEKLSLFTSIEKSMFVGISLINNSSHLSIENNDNTQVIINKKNIKSFVHTMEESDVGKINQNQLNDLVKAFDKLNKRKIK